MALNNIKTLRKDSGFTIVELLIVIVVIAILATISIVAYTGIQNRARATKAQANANQVQKIAEAFYADAGRYPSQLIHFTTSNTYATLPSSITIPTNATATTASSITSANGENTIGYRYVGPAASATGGCAIWFDFANNTTAFVYLGNANSGNCSATLGNHLAA